MPNSANLPSFIARHPRAARLVARHRAQPYRPIGPTGTIRSVSSLDGVVVSSAARTVSRSSASTRQDVAEITGALSFMLFWKEQIEGKVEQQELYEAPRECGRMAARSASLPGLEGCGMTYCPLDLVEAYLRRFVSYPSEHALAAHTLWICHTYLMEEWDTTPRIAFMSAEPMSGKTRALEVSEHLACDPLMGFAMTAAVTVRLVAERPRTVLFD